MISAKRQPIEAPRPAAKEISGKYVIIAVVAVAVTGAAVSWIVRYNATHRAAEFWGPEAAVLIRDAPIVKLYEVTDGQRTFSLVRALSKAPGLTHLRNALLEDRNFNWPAEKSVQPRQWRWALGFSQQGQPEQFVLELSDDFKELVCTRDKNSVLNSEPIAAGLKEMFDEFSKPTTSNSDDQPR